MPDELLTLRQLSQELQLPESTVRYYRNIYLAHVPSVGTGRRRRYPREALAVLRSIADGYASGRSRGEIVVAIGGQESDLAVLAASPAKASQRADEVSNLDLLAAILDGEREQRDALWQMAKEIVRLTEVLETQDGVLTQIADQAGVALPAAKPVATLAPPPEPDTRPEGRARQEQVLQDSPAPGPSGPVVAEPGLQSGSPVPTPVALPRDVVSLREELEAERALVERLRVAKLQLEHRAADAEAALEEQRTTRRSSGVLRRLLGDKS